MSTSLLEVIRKRFLETIRSVNPPDKWKILVIDEHSQKLLNAVLKTYDVLEENVSLIEAINSRRPSQPQTEAMYLLMPTTANVNRVIADFSGNQPQYAAAHVFFLDGLPEALFERLASSPAEPYLRQLVDLYLNFTPSESRVFDFHSPEMFYSFLSPPRDPGKVTARLKRLDNELRYCSKLLLNICISLNENPLVRYYQPPHHGPLGPLAENPNSAPTTTAAAPPVGSSRYYSAEAAPPPSEGGLRWARAAALRATEAASSSSLALVGGSGVGAIPMGDGLAKKLATMFQAELDDYRKVNTDFPKPEPGRPRGTVIITDRTMDALAPFLHEFTYQAMANDLLPIENGKSYKYRFASATAPGGYEERTATLTDNDVLWTQVRHMHMKDAIDKLMADFNKFLEENAGFRAGEGATSLNDMKDMLAGLPQYQDMREKFSLHLTMAQQCMDLFEQKKLPLTANIQQICATGLTPDRKTPKKLVEDMVPLLDMREVSSRDKVRIIALYIMYRDGVPEEDQRRLFQHARLSLAEQDAVKNLVRLGVRMNRASGDRDTKKLKFKTSSNNDEEEYELSRYKPVVHHVLSEHIGGRLEQSSFPYVRDAPTSFSQNLAASSPTSASSVVRGSDRGARLFGNRGGASGAGSVSSAPSSLRSAKPAANRPSRPGMLDGGASFGSARSGASGGLAEREPIRQRVILFVAGGMTYSEIRTAYQVGARLQRDVYIGSTHVITPERFIDDLKVLEMEGVGSVALPNGLPTSGPASGEYQDYYDKRYFTPDAPPPPAAAAPPLSSGRYANGGGMQKPSNANLRPPPGPNGSPTPSQSSVASSGATKEKKKHRLFGF